MKYRIAIRFSNDPREGLDYYTFGDPYSEDKKSGFVFNLEHASIYSAPASYGQWLETNGNANCEVILEMIEMEELDDLVVL